MGLCLDKVFNRAKEHKRILMLGLKGSGKTTILNKLQHVEEDVTKIPAIGFHFETVEYTDYRLTIWEIGGQDNSVLWNLFIKTNNEFIDGLIFVVDSSDEEKIELAKQEFQKLLKEDLLRQASVLVLLNKQELGVMRVPDVVNRLDLHKTLLGKDWYVQGITARTGDGLNDGLDWLTKTFKKKS